MSPKDRSPAAFTLIELIVIVSILALLAFVLIPSVAKARQKAQRIHCVSRLKQIGVSFRLWSGDSSDRFPMARSTNDQGTLEVASEVWRTFQVLSNELSTPYILACPSDSRTAANEFTNLSNASISYFIGLDAEEDMPQLLLAGDRHVSVGRPALSKIVTIHTNDVVKWVGQSHLGEGNAAFADGSVQQLNSARLQEGITNLFAIYRNERTNAPLRLAMPE